MTRTFFVAVLRSVPRSLLVLTVFGSTLQPSSADTVGEQLTYRGTFVPADADPQDAATKMFQLDWLVVAADADATSLVWVLEETGAGGWAWPDRLGRLTIATTPPANPADEPSSDALPSLFVDRGEQSSAVIPLTAPLFRAPVPLAHGAQWDADRLQWTVQRGQRDGHDIWKVESRSAIGHQQTLWVDQQTSIVLAGQQTVFIGRGEQHRLTWQVDQRHAVSSEATQQVDDRVAAWQQLLAELRFESGQQRIVWNDQQLGLLKQRLPALAESNPWAPLEAIAKAAAHDGREQSNRAGAVASIKGKALGRVVDLALIGVDGQATTIPAPDAKITVLHFWDYRESPLSPPYGQSGYFDFLARRHPEVTFYGVCVNDRFSQVNQRRQIIRSGRKFSEFMNLKYPLLFDDGQMLRVVGDPRAAGLELPVYVVLDAGGKILHYHAGLYEVDRDLGLAELDQAIRDAQMATSRDDNR